MVASSLRHLPGKKPPSIAAEDYADPRGRHTGPDQAQHLPELPGPSIIRAPRIVAEAHHDVYVQDEAGKRLGGGPAARRGGGRCPVP